MRKITAFQLIDAAHSKDPQIEKIDQKEIPKELLYSNRMINWLLKFEPQANELQQIAAKCQHLYRWKVARSEYPLGKKGYHQWRIFLYSYQANKAAEIMEQCGYSAEEIDSVKEMVSKKSFKDNEDSQTLEDVTCLVFIAFYLEGFATKHQDDKLIKIIQRTWKKMSPKARDFALEMEHSKNVLALIKSALEVK
jgi:hypothetical protein